MKLWHKIVIGGVGLAGAVNAPVIPAGQLKFDHAYTTLCVLPTTVNSTSTPVREYTPKCTTGNAYVSVFTDPKGNKHYVEIPQAQYEKMGGVDGDSYNPTETEYKSVLQVL